MIRHFQLGDIFLIQRLGRQATRLNTIQSLVQPSSILWTSLSSVIPWGEAKVTTYVLRQQGHGLARAGFLQVQKRPRRPESDIVFLSPGLEMRWGHPAIWEKLLSHYIQEASKQEIARIYVDLPDQPLPVSTLSHVGFKVYTRQTVWRLSPHRLEPFDDLLTAHIRPARPADEWALQRLYHQTVPNPVQKAEGIQDDNSLKAPIVDWWLPGLCNTFVLEEKSDIQGAAQIVQGATGYWLRLWIDTNKPNTDKLHQLIRFVLTFISQHTVDRSIYIGVRDYQSGVGSVLSDYAFAPFTDRAKMVKPVIQWIRNVAPVRHEMLDAVPEAIPTPYTLPPHTLPSSSHEAEIMPKEIFSNRWELS